MANAKYGTRAARWLTAATIAILASACAASESPRSTETTRNTLNVAPSASPGNTATIAERICQNAIAYYERLKTSDPVGSQVAANEAIGEAVKALERTGSRELEPLTQALQDLASIGQQLAIAMDRGEPAASDLFEAYSAAGDLVVAEAEAVGAPACARIAAEM
ncbi:hypothetical protein [Catelliglobosispora koreensis]|uniref:hypothetical protein n=1 Tax=Catelliglobosispora koreensis TaxID=129052 RepID=UPI0003809571|nr:hypothetical protein [Catelliglobosispora koreensis]